MNHQIIFGDIVATESLPVEISSWVRSDGRSAEIYAWGPTPRMVALFPKCTAAPNGLAVFRKVIGGKKRDVKSELHRLIEVARTEHGLLHVPLDMFRPVIEATEHADGALVISNPACAFSEIGAADIELSSCQSKPTNGDPFGPLDEDGDLA